MPRETVTPMVGPYEVKVGWASGRDVQVAVTIEGDRSIFWTLFPDHRALGEMVRKLPSNAPEVVGQALLNQLDVMTDMATGLWSTFDREDVNRLIRVLRRARDSAFGRDE